MPGFVIAFVFNAYVALVTLAVFPFIAIAGALLVSANQKAAEVSKPRSVAHLIPNTSLD